MSLWNPVSFNLSASSPHIVLYNQGPVIGSLDFVSVEGVPSDVIGVDISLEEEANGTFKSKPKSPHLSICSLTRDEVPWGIGVCVSLPTREIHAAHMLIKLSSNCDRLAHLHPGNTAYLRAIRL